MLNSSLKAEELAGLTPDMVQSMSFRSEKKAKNQFEFDYMQRASKILNDKGFEGSPRQSMRDGVDDFSES